MSADFSILLVDGDAAFRKSFSTLLKSRCSDVAEAGDKDQALSLIRAKDPELLFIDLDLPNGSGFEVLKTVVREFPEILSVAVTGVTRQSTVIQAFQAGAQDFIRKQHYAKDFDAVFSRVGAVASRKRNKAFQPGLLANGLLELELESAGKAIPPAVENILNLLSAVIGERELRPFELVLHEAVRNAYEHGNLGVTSQEKVVLCENATFEAELERRSVDARRAGKKIRISVHVSPELFECTIKDDGKGFKWKKLPDPLLHPEMLLNPNGRGVLLMRKFFDEVSYNRKGNAVTLKKRLNHSKKQS